MPRKCFFQRLGFSKEELLAAIEKLKAQLQESENPYDVGLAALYDKHYGKAAQLIEKAITAAEKEIREGKREEELLPEKYLNLGNARAGEHKLNEAVAAYEKAIALKPDDAAGYFHLAKVLYVMGDAKGTMKNWQKALTIYRRASLGKATANEAATLGNLGLVFNDLGQPDSSRVYHQAALKIAREIGYRQLDSTDLSFQADFAEKHFTTGRFPAAEKRLATLLLNLRVEPRVKIALRAIGVAIALAQNKTPQLPAELETLQQNLAAQADTFQVGWSFEGTKHFISIEPKLTRYREWLLQFFAAMEGENREAILTALREVWEKFGAVIRK